MIDRRNVCPWVVLLALAVCGRAADGGTLREIGFNINQLQVTARTPAGVANPFAVAAPIVGVDLRLRFTGDLLFRQWERTVTKVSIDGGGHTVMSPAGFLLDGIVHLTNGEIDGGSFTLNYTMPAGTPGAGTHAAYHFGLASDSGSIRRSVPNRNSKYMLTGATENGSFDSDSFGGQDVSDWYRRPGFGGSFVTLEFMPTGTAAVDKAANLNLSAFTVVPNPSAVAGGGVLVAGTGLLALRRRRGAS